MRRRVIPLNPGVTSLELSPSILPFKGADTMILVVDDDKILTQLLKNLLEDAGYEVRVANDGETA